MDRQEVERWLAELRLEHRDLDEVIQQLIQVGHLDVMRIQRLKKRKLKLKDMIARLESELIPDMDA
ncbi:MAG: YdcH family protein [Pseudomonadales bacterium]